MNKSKIILVIIPIIIIFYIASYCCTYTAIIMYNILKGFNPEYRITDMENSEYSHVYIHVFDKDLFLNPFREYEDGYRTYKTTEELLNSGGSYGEFYIPIINKWIKIW